MKTFKEFEHTIDEVKSSITGPYGVFKKDNRPKSVKLIKVFDSMKDANDFAQSLFKKLTPAERKVDTSIYVKSVQGSARGAYEEVAANSVSGGGVDLSPAKHKDDKRKKYAINKMYRRSVATDKIENAK